MGIDSQDVYLHQTATLCNTLQHTATHCNILQHTATYCITLHHTASRMCIYIRPPHLRDTPGARECESERESARVRARAREREENKETDGRGRRSLRRGALKKGQRQSGCVSNSDPSISDMPRTEMMYFKDGRLITDHGLVMQYTATQCHTLQLTAIHCNALQHTATRVDTRRINIENGRLITDHVHVVYILRRVQHHPLPPCHLWGCM